MSLATARPLPSTQVRVEVRSRGAAPAGVDGPAVRRRAGLVVRPALRLVTSGEAGLVPLGEVLVPAGRRPVLRLVPAGPRVGATGTGHRVDPANGSREARRAARSGVPTTRRRRAAARPERAGQRDRSTAARVRASSAPRLRPPVLPAGRVRPLARGAVRLGLVLVVALLGARLGAAGAAEPASAAVGAPAPRVVVVEQGDSLWSIARELAPDADPRVLVGEVRALNDLDGAALAVGQRLLVPAGA